MGELNLTRRAFTKLAAVTGAAVACTAAAPNAALAEDAGAAARGDDVKRVRTCCRGCGKMECGVWVTVQNGRAVKVEGDQSSFQSSGNCCGKSQSSIQAAYHPDRIYHPMKRTNPKGEDPGWQRITWDEAMQTIGEKFQQIIDRYGGQSIFNMAGTSRQWVYGPYAFYKWLFDTPNAHVASEICKGPRRLMGWISSVDGAPWMALRDGPRVYVQWGTAPENSNYDDSCRNLVDKMNEADVHICIDPRLSGSGKEADYWLNLKPGTDGALALCWQHIIIEHDLVDWEFVKRWTDASLLVVEDMEPTGGRYIDLSSPVQVPPLEDLIGTKLKTRLLKESDLKEGGSPHKFYAWNKNANDGAGGLVYWDADATQWEGCNHVAPTRDQMEVVYKGTSQEGYLPPLSYWELEEAGIDFDLKGTHEIELADGTKHVAKPVWAYLEESVKECTTEWCQEKTGLDPALVEEACLAWATRPEGQTYGNGGIHLNLAPDQVGNCAQTVRAVLHLSYMTGNFDGPAGNRGLTRTPVDEQATAAPGVNMPQEVKWTLKGMEAITGEPQCPPFYLPDVKLEPTNIPDRREILSNMVGAEKFPILPYYNEWADATCIWEACINGDPYPLKGGINESGSFMNMSNATLAWEALSKLDFWVDINMFHHPGTEMADIILPCQHWTELNNIRVSQGASGGIGLTQRAIEPPADTKFDYDINRLIFEALEKQGNPNGTWMSIKGDGPGAYHHDDRLEEWFQAHNEKSGFDTRYPGCKWEHFEDFKEDFQENGWINAKEIEPDRWGTYRRFETGWMHMGKDACTAAPWSVDDSGQPVNNFGCPTPNALVEFWSMAFETYCIDMANEFEPGKFDPIKEMMPNYEPPASSADGGKIDLEEYPIILTTGRRIPVYFHSEHRQLPWCRELWPAPRLEMNPADAAELGLEQGDWAWIETEWGKVRQSVDLYHGIAKGWANAEHAWWFPELPAPTHGCMLSNIECIWDPHGQDKFISSHHMRGVPVKIYKATPENCPDGKVIPCAPEDGTEIIYDASDPRLKEWLPNYEIRKEA
ncbi:molybdopterin-containing oxidoreductase family protein [Eggerthella lenta]|uniref:molybdopterin-containing oxidoreductase family protein n=1 Tax=Eggerthella lenta TaxID=84112 RepID=UPI00232BCDE3|nr:molybdopterin-dependent oxidoreductase [Eggerthella lenta]MDB1765833.1 molybdopterin-dependent oxidoreductase [Eggerthella lenta]MDB1771954.1 molybdopterin-dependent oxidoreductase [Eggerthella lenta]MDB1780296.1 molybdopterin-dependent oxidoreductase [Eggerthella lenta]